MKEESEILGSRNIRKATREEEYKGRKRSKRKKGKKIGGKKELACVFK